jgi:hypothetical protein
VGSFVAVVPCFGAAVEAEGLFLRATRAMKVRNPCKTDSIISNPWSFVGSYGRWNGSGSSAIAADRGTGNWLAVVGTAFHQSGRNHPKYLLEQYFKIGAARLARDLDGFFVVIAGNASTREIVVITDIVGSLHFYCRQFSVGTALSTSSLLVSELEPVTLDPVGCQEFVGTGVMYEDRTFYNEVKKLPPATITTFVNGGKSAQQQYWNVTDLNPELLTAEQSPDALWTELTSAVARINKQFASVACDLTGGYDSRAVTAAFLEDHGKFATVVSGPPNSGDVIISRGLAEMLGLAHVCYPPSLIPITCGDLDATLELTDGEYDLVEYINVARIHHDLSQRAEISINGSFGELARGYWWELLLPHTGARRKLDSHRLAARRYALGPYSALFQPSYRLNLVEHIKGVIDRCIAGLETYPNSFQMDVTYLRMRMQRWQGRIASSTNRIWPCLSPFMFRPVLETMLQTRFAVRQRSLLVRLMLAKYQPRLATYPLEHGYPALPATWRTIPKFWPLVPYYAGKVRQKVERKIFRKRATDGQNSRLQIWEMEEVKRLLQPSTMKSLDILDPSAMAAFLENSRKLEFPQNSEWRRLLTLEWALSRSTVNPGIQ